MKRIVQILGMLAVWPGSVALPGCEGEPPINSPENPPPPAASEVPAAPAASAGPAVGAPEAGAAMALSGEPSTSGTPSMPAVVGPDAASAPPPVETSDAGAPAGESHRWDIVGTVATKPAWSAAQAVVYLEEAPKDEASPPPRTITVDNRQMAFIPFVAVSSVGAKVVFANSDPFPHNVFSPDNEKFNLGNLAQNGGAHSRTFSSPGAYSLLCNLHPGMLGYLLVVPTTYFARTDAKGHFVLKHLPPGTYRVTAWAPRVAPQTQAVTVGDADATAAFELHR
jgi:plastocyanin